MKTPRPLKRAEQVRRLFDEVVELDPDARAARLEQIQQRDASLGRELAQLLAGHEDADVVLEVYERFRQAATGPHPSPILKGRTGQMVSHYRVLEHHGAGGMGVVYKARDLKLDRTVALKCLPAPLRFHDEAKRRFLQEARAAAKLDHPHICPIYEIDETADGLLFIAMAYVEGETLKQKIKQGPLPIPDAVDLAIQAAKGLGCAHAHGIVHRDVKPANVIVTSDGVAKLVDFGVAQVAGTELTRTGQALGTVAYMAPEQVRAETVDHRADLWALGVVLYEMLTGRRPFNGSDEPAVCYSIVHEAPEPVQMLRPEVPDALAQIVEKLLRKDPDVRYQTADAARADLQTLGRVAATARPAASIQQYTKAGRMRGWFYGVAVLLLIGMLALWMIPGRVAGPERPINSVAVLPLANLSGDLEQAYFADGMTEELIAVLGQIKSLRVISRTSVMRYKGTNKSLPEIAQELGVAAVVEGSVAQAGNQVRVGVRLIDGATEERLWEQRFQREMRDVLTLQREVALAIAREIELELAIRERIRLAATRAVDPEAFRLYLKGIQYRNADTHDNLQRAAAYFEQAVQRDSSLAPAYAGIATTYTILGGFSTLLPRKEAEAKAQHAAERALAVDSALSEAHLAQGMIREIFDWDWTGAEQAFRQAIALNPGNSTARYELGWLLARTGRLQQAQVELNRAAEQDPLSPLIHYALSWIDLNSGRLDRAIAQGREVLLLEPGFAHAYIVIGDAYLAKGMHSEALAALEKLVAETSGNVHSLGYLGHAYAVSGRSAEALEILEELKTRWRQGEQAAFDVAQVYAGLGKEAQALDWLEKACLRREGSLLYLKLDPLYLHLRTEPRFQALLEKMKLAEDLPSEPPIGRALRGSTRSPWAVLSPTVPLLSRDIPSFSAMRPASG